jgi:hypothetical protein
MNAVTGIVNPGRTTSGEEVNLLGYFNGSLVSTNRNGQAVAINFLDDGGATPLKENKPCSSGDNSKNQCKLLNHLYQYFGALLGCDAEGFPSYAGSTSQSAVHRYMNLDTNEVTYFIEQVGAAAASFGVSSEDITTVATTLGNVFNVRCAPAAKVPSTAETAYSQSICVASDCPLAENSDCSATSDMSFPNGTNGVEPQRASASTSSSMSGGSSTTRSGSAPTGSTTTRPDGASMLTAVNAFGALALGAAGLVAISL